MCDVTPRKNLSKLSKIQNAVKIRFNLSPGPKVNVTIFVTVIFHPSKINSVEKSFCACVILTKKGMVTSPSLTEFVKKIKILIFFPSGSIAMTCSGWRACQASSTSSSPKLIHPRSKKAESKLFLSSTVECRNPNVWNPNKMNSHSQTFGFRTFGSFDLKFSS